MTRSTDAIIVGGGLVGMTTALALSAFGARTAVIDNADLDKTLEAGFDGRATAIASATWRMFGALGIAERLAEVECPIEEIRVSEGVSRRWLAFDGRGADSDTGEQEALGHMIENRFIRKALIEAGRDTADIDIRAPEDVLSIERAEHGVSVSLSSGETLKAPLLIGADGRRSRIREEAGIRAARWQYGHTAIVGMIDHELDHGHVAYEIFYPTGPFALLPMLPGTRSAIVWSVPGEEAKAWLGLPERAFMAEVDKRMGGVLGKTAMAAPPMSYPLGFHHAERYTAERLALVGDSAHGIHPIAGQGLNMGLRDSAALAEVIGEGLRLGLDIGEPEVLDRYQRWRGFDNFAVAASTDLLTRLFGIPGKTMKRVRSFGLNAVERIPPLKTFFMQEARGATGDLPQLLRGERP
ncbi:ubiquinone biosynthesis protein UbiH [Pacificimonas flava]|uniref:Ubiquinone biosynthesis protein UbiH n=2 Tax=Pacificimonas TaxID=1960290 RepID=A0A219B385_9SPHN|nr:MULTISPECIES: UbiH/UbiF/VisC/COQ6 family ubiquinone biosynthesis hydroxylase [Pacificimonas]MBZ6377546.1 UbiH/UbiF/VisC/COQ6 family ubiquinone biosynthesis hydroxylase [Pacificimonas aurantium]OWV32761.1 ubiquinone biosynthesis protein UbiH [Pacificimonas flava]